MAAARTAPTPHPAASRPASDAEASWWAAGDARRAPRPSDARRRRRRAASTSGSEVGALRRVLLHRPDLELKRLTPRNKDELLFDDVLWVKRARQEHDAFADTLADRGVEVLYLDACSPTSSTTTQSATRCSTRTLDAVDLGPSLSAEVREWLASSTPPSSRTG